MSTECAYELKQRLKQHTQGPHGSARVLCVHTMASGLTFLWDSWLCEWVWVCGSCSFCWVLPFWTCDKTAKVWDLRDYVNIFLSAPTFLKKLSDHIPYFLPFNMQKLVTTTLPPSISMPAKSDTGILCHCVTLMSHHRHGHPWMAVFIKGPLRWAHLTTKVGH